MPGAGATTRRRPRTRRHLSAGTVGRLPLIAPFDFGGEFWSKSKNKQHRDRGSGLAARAAATAYPRRDADDASSQTQNVAIPVALRDYELRVRARVVTNGRVSCRGTALTPRAYNTSKH